MALRFEFDPVNKVLLLRREGRLTEELMTESQKVFQEYWAATDPSGGIDDFSKVTEVVASTEFVRQLAHQEQPGDATKLPRVIVAPTTVVFGLARMFQILGERMKSFFPALSSDSTSDHSGVQYLSIPMTDAQVDGSLVTSPLGLRIRFGSRSLCKCLSAAWAEAAGV